MRLTLLTFLFPVLAFSQSSGGCAPEDLRASIMDVLTNLDEANDKPFKALYITESEFYQLVDQLTLGEESKEMIREEKGKEFLDEMSSKEFKDLINDGREHDVTWKKIKYEDFFYRIRLRNGVKELKGDIYLQEGDKHYEIRVQAVFLNEEFHVVELERFDESYELHGYPEGYEEHYETAIEVIPDAEIREVEPPAPEEDFQTGPPPPEAALSEEDVEIRDLAIHSLFELFHALDTKDYEKAKSLLVLPEGVSSKEMNMLLGRILENKEIDLEGIAHLDADGIFGTVEEIHGDWGLNKVAKTGLNKEECYALYKKGSNIECMFHWNGVDTLRFFRVDNIR